MKTNNRIQHRAPQLKCKTLAGWAVTTIVLITPPVFVGAGIPEPSTVIYGQILETGRAVPASAAYDLIARIQNQPHDLARYTMGDNGALGDLYLLQLRLESLVDGATPRQNYARVGDTIEVYTVEPGQGEQLALTFTVADRGQVLYRDLGERRFGDYNADATISLEDHTGFVFCLDEAASDDGQCIAAFDADNDAAVTLADYAAFRLAFENP